MILVKIDLPKDSADKLLRAWKEKDPELFLALTPFNVVDIQGNIGKCAVCKSEIFHGDKYVSGCGYNLDDMFCMKCVSKNLHH